MDLFLRQNVESGWSLWKGPFQTMEQLANGVGEIFLVTFRNHQSNVTYHEMVLLSHYRQWNRKDIVVQSYALSQ